MNRSIILLWKGQLWESHTIYCRTGLTADLPVNISHSDSRGEFFTFVLAGDCAGTPIYKQAD